MKTKTDESYLVSNDYSQIVSCEAEIHFATQEQFPTLSTVSRMSPYLQFQVITSTMQVDAKAILARGIPQVGPPP